ncbi:MAG: SurA N-terminal domain-containing protein [Muribaculaceae bacterium]|nr:SurA N-terminal domain-containing protein [Muribaculaceae bacterium]
MSTLEKIRNKPVLLVGIIVLALLAFILGDFLTSGRTYFGHPTTVAKAGAATVEYQDYQNRLSQAGDQYRSQGREVSSDVLSQNVIQGLLAEELLKNEYSDLGLVVTDDELTEAMTGTNQHPAAAQMIMYISQQLNLPEASPAAVYDAMQNPAKYGLPTQVADQLRQAWTATEQQVEQNILQNKFNALLQGLYTYNKVDAKAFYDDNATTRTVAYVSADASSIADADVDFTEADIKNYWNNHKQNYRLDEPLTEISYIYMPIEPSQQDRMAAQQTVENAIAGLRSSEGTDAVANNTKFNVNTTKNALRAIRDNRLKDSIAANEVGYAFLYSRNNDTYTIVKILDRNMGIDSLNISMLQAAPSVDMDSLAAAINAAKAPFADFNTDEIQGRDSVWVNLEAENIQSDLRDKLANAPVGQAFVNTETVQGQDYSVIYRVNNRKAAVPFYEYATIEYTVDPSQETLAELTSNLRTFISNNSSAEEFAANAGDAGYSVLTDQVGASSTGIGNARDSRKFVKWAVENKKGKVSPMLQDDRQSYLMAIAVIDKYEDYLPYTSPAVNTQLRTQALNDKKAAALYDKYNKKGDDMATYAQIFGKEIEHGNVNILSPALLTVGLNEAALHGAIAAAEQGKMVGPLKGNRGVLVFEVEAINSENRPFVEADYGTRFNQTYGITRTQNPLRLLIGKNKVDNRSLNFIQGVEE